MQRQYVLIFLLGVLMLTPQVAGSYDLSWWTVDGGGDQSSGGNYAFTGTTGQPDAGAASGGTYALRGGLWVMAAEMNVKQGATTISSGSGSYNFGTVTVGSNTSVAFTIENTGTANLTLTGTPLKVAISGTNAGDFSVPLQPTSPVAPKRSATFTLRFAPTATGARTATVSMANNDSNENPYTFTVNGTGAAAPSGNSYLLWTR